MNIIQKLAQEQPPGNAEQTEIDRQLAAAYAADENAATLKNVDRLAEKVRIRLENEQAS